jgi:four helix bundle protein
MGTEQAPAKTFCDLIVWRKAHEFVLSAYRFTADFPREELYGLSSQLRRATISVAANVAEGFCGRGRAYKARFMNTAERSLRNAGTI